MLHSLLLNYKECRKNTIVCFSWQLYLVSFAEAFFLYEKGFRKFDFNFSWGYMYGIFFCHFCALVLLVRKTAKMMCGGAGLGTVGSVQGNVKLQKPPNRLDDGIHLKFLERMIDRTHLKASDSMTSTKYGGSGNVGIAIMLLAVQGLAFFSHVVCGLFYFKTIFGGAMYY